MTPRAGREADAAVPAIPAGRDRVIDLARAVSLVMVAIGHWLVVDLQPGGDGALQVTDVLAALPSLSFLTWIFQVMPVFFFAGGAVGFPSWRRHRSTGGSWGAWMGQRLARLWWPTVPVLAFWTAGTQVAGRAFGVSDEVLKATQGIALVIWFLAIYVLVVALTAVLDALCSRLGVRALVLLAVAVGLVDAAAFAGDYVSTTSPSWVWVNYLLVWSVPYALGRWWGPLDRHRGPVGAVGAGAALAVLVALVQVGPYPLSMVGVTGQARSNSLPPTLALLALGLVQIGVLWALRPMLARLLASPRRYVIVAALGSRAMTIYLWHLLAVAVMTVAVVLPGLWPATVVGGKAWWAARIGWLGLCATITTPVVLAVSPLERPPRWLPVTTDARRVTLAVVTAGIAWAALAIGGFHVDGAPLALPWVPLAATLACGLLLRAPHDPAAQPRPVG